MKRMIENILLSAEFHHRAEIHNADFIGNVFHDGKIVRNEKISKLSFPL